MTSTSSHYFAFRFKNMGEEELKWDAVQPVLTKKNSRSEERLPWKTKNKQYRQAYACLRRNAMSEARPPKPAKASVAGSGPATTLNELNKGMFGGKLGARVNVVLNAAE